MKKLLNIVVTNTDPFAFTKGGLTDWAAAEIKHSGDELDVTIVHPRNNAFERTRTRLFSAACPG